MMFKKTSVLRFAMIKNKINFALIKKGQTLVKVQN